MVSLSQEDDDSGPRLQTPRKLDRRLRRSQSRRQRLIPADALRTGAASEPRLAIRHGQRTVDAASTITLLEAIEALYPLMMSSSFDLT
jgi:hypothetical protein